MSNPLGIQIRGDFCIYPMIFGYKKATDGNYTVGGTQL